LLSAVRISATSLRSCPRGDAGSGVTAKPVGIAQRAGKWIGVLMRKAGVERERKEFADFYQRSRDDCLRAVLASTDDRALADDLVAEGFARAWASWQKVSRHPAPAAWVVRTALNVGVSWWRRRRREVALDGRDRAQLSGDGFVMDEVLLSAVRELPHRQREVIVLRVWLDLDTKTVADVLGISANTVAVHLSRATATLRAQLVTAS
jgi:RNA polymerase sigma-70 factor (ECF subfamily)